MKKRSRTLELHMEKEKTRFFFGTDVLKVISRSENIFLKN